MWRLAALVVSAGLAGTAGAQSLHGQMQDAYAAWLAEAGTVGQIATAQPGTAPELEAPAGAPARVELASLSKVVTALCTLDLVTQGRLDWSDRLPDLLGDAPDVTVAQLVTHTSGLAPDSTQASMPFWLDQSDATRGHYSDQVLMAANARQANAGTPGTYLYSNENYALLGLVIEAVTGAPYLDHCSDALDLRGFATASDRTMRMQPWGGLVATPGGYLAFVQAHFGPGSAIGQDPFAYPHADAGHGSYYGLGMAFRPYGDGFNFWHFGALCFPDRLTVGTYVVLYQDRAAAMAAFDGCLPWDALYDLDAAMVGAVYGAAQ